MPEWLPAVLLFLFGSAIGSHLNVLVLRFGFVERSSPRSECAQCGVVIRWYDLIPVLSYFSLKGRCRSCGSALNIQYPLVEAVTGILFALAYFAFPPDVTPLSLVQFAALLAAIASALGIVVYDIRHTLVPLPFVYVLGGSAFIFRALEAAMAGGYGPLMDAALGASALGGFFALITLATRGRGMGIGDAYVASAVGILLGFVPGVTAVIVGVWSATAVYLGVMLSSRLRLFGGAPRVTMKTELPFAPWLLFGAAVVLAAGLSILEIGEWIPRFP
ncbi:MAG: prepilin peptidase [Patescibacteria group bacterium]